MDTTVHTVWIFGFDRAGVEQAPELHEIEGMSSALKFAQEEWSTGGCGLHILVGDPNHNRIMELWPTGQLMGEYSLNL